MIATEQAFLVPQNLDEAETLVNKLTIEDLRAFCFRFGLSQDGTKASLKERLMEYYEEKFKSSLGSPVPMPRRRIARISTFSLHFLGRYIRVFFSAY